MSISPSPFVSEFESEAQTPGPGRWLHAKTTGKQTGPSPSSPHDQAMAHLREKLTAKLSDQQKKNIIRPRSRHH